MDLFKCIRVKVHQPMTFSTYRTVVYIGRVPRRTVESHENFSERDLVAGEPIRDHGAGEGLPSQKTNTTPRAPSAHKKNKLFSISHAYAARPLHNKKKTRFTMTIMIERNSPLRVIDTSSSPQGSSGTSHDSSVSLVEDDFVVVDYTPLCSLPVVGKLRSSTSLDDEDTASTGSLSSDDNSSEGYYQDKRVSFTEDVVTDVWTRPFTPREQVSDLFYSTEETSR